MLRSEIRYCGFIYFVNSVNFWDDVTRKVFNVLGLTEVRNKHLLLLGAENYNSPRKTATLAKWRPWETTAEIPYWLGNRETSGSVAAREEGDTRRKDFEILCCYHSKDWIVFSSTFPWNYIFSWYFNVWACGWNSVMLPLFSLCTICSLALTL